MEETRLKRSLAEAARREIEPNGQLKRILYLAEEAMRRLSTNDDLDVLSAAILDLDDYLRQGGALPERWAEKRAFNSNPTKAERWCSCVGSPNFDCFLHGRDRSGI